MQSQSTWMRVFFLLAALALAVLAVPIDSSSGAVARQAAPAAPSDVTAPSTDDDDTDFDALFRREMIIERELGSEEIEVRSEIGAIAKLGEDGAKLLEKGGSKAPAAGAASKAVSAAESAVGKGKAAAAKPAAAAAPAAKAKAAAGKVKNDLPSAIPSNSKINKLKDQDTLFFSGTGGKAGTDAAKAFAKQHNLKTIDDAFPPGTFSNFKQFGGTDAEKTQFLKDASENFAKAVKPGKGKVFVAFPGDKPPADGIFSKIEAPALKANGHTALTKLDLNNLGKIADPHSITDEFHL